MLLPFESCDSFWLKWRFFLNKIVIFSSQNQFDRKSSSNCKKSSFQVRCITWFKRQQNRTFTNGDHLCAWRLDLNCTKLICNLPLSCQIGSDLKILGAVDMFFYSIWNDKEIVVLIIISREFSVSKESSISNLTRLLLFFSKGYTKCSETYLIRNFNNPFCLPVKGLDSQGFLHYRAITKFSYT